MCLWQAALHCQHPAPDTHFLNSSPRKSLSVPIFKLSVGPHLFSRPFSDPAPSRNCPRFKAQSPRLSFEAFCDLTTAIQVPPLNLCFPEHLSGLHTCEAFNCCPNSY